MSYCSCVTPGYCNRCRPDLFSIVEYNGIIFYYPSGGSPVKEELEDYEEIITDEDIEI